MTESCAALTLFFLITIGYLVILTSASDLPPQHIRQRRKPQDDGDKYFVDWAESGPNSPSSSSSGRRSQNNRPSSGHTSKSTAVSTSSGEQEHQVGDTESEPVVNNSNDMPMLDPDNPEAMDNARNDNANNEEGTTDPVDDLSAAPNAESSTERDSSSIIPSDEEQNGSSRSRSGSSSRNRGSSSGSSSNDKRGGHSNNGGGDMGESAPDEDEGQRLSDLNLFNKHGSVGGEVASSVPAYNMTENKSPMDLKKFNEEMLVAHNYYRQLHCAKQDLTLSNDLTRRAQNYSQWMADHNNFRHNKDKYYSLGESVWWGNYKPTGTEVADDWYSEIEYYDFDRPKFSESTGHFTQMVWLLHNNMGAGAQRAKDASWYVTAYYYPGGNYDEDGGYKENVVRPTCPAKIPKPQAPNGGHNKRQRKLF